jgi:hypothetical protein
MVDNLEIASIMRARDEMIALNPDCNIIILIANDNLGYMWNTIETALYGIDIVVSCSDNFPSAPLSSNVTERLDSSTWNKLLSGITETYPMLYENVVGARVLNVRSGTKGQYIGHLIVEFDDAGVITSWSPQSNNIALTSALQEATETHLGIAVYNETKKALDTANLLLSAPNGKVARSLFI